MCNVKVRDTQDFLSYTLQTLIANQHGLTLDAGRPSGVKGPITPASLGYLDVDIYQDSSRLIIATFLSREVHCMHAFTQFGENNSQTQTTPCSHSCTLALFSHFYMVKNAIFGTSY